MEQPDDDRLEITHGELVRRSVIRRLRRARGCGADAFQFARRQQRVGAAHAVAGDAEMREVVGGCGFVHRVFDDVDPIFRL